jgi:hypothetical protein
MAGKHILFIFLLFISSLQLWAVDTVFVNEKALEDYYLRGSYLEIFEDKKGELGIGQVSSPLYKDSFIVHQDKNAFAYIKNTSSVYWIKFVLKAVLPVSKPYILENLDLHIDHFEFYKEDPAQKGKFIKENAGFSLPFDVRKYPHKNFVFDVTVDTIPRAYYARIKSHNHNPFLFKIKSTSNFSYYALNEYYLLGMFYGILAIMAVYNFLIYLSLRERVYIYYVVYVLCCAIISFGEDGTGFQYLWPESPSLNTYIAMFAPLLLMVSFSIYSKNFLEMKRNVPLMDKLLNWMIFAYILFFILDNFILHLNWEFPLYIIPFLVIYIASILCLKKGFRQARYYIVGYSFMFVSIIFLIFRMSGVIHWDDIFTVYSFNIGLIFEIVILSFALGDRIKIMKEENEISQKRIIEQLKENEKLKDKVNRELEEKVRERTQELKEKNEELEEAYEEIRRMNQLLESDNKVLKTNVKELSKARVLMKEVDFSEFSQIFPDRESCLKYLEDLKWKKGYKCKKCGNPKWCNGKDDFSKRCTKCRYDESPTAYTIFHKLKFPITKAFYMLFLVYANKEKITSLELSQILQLRQSTCWNFNRKINEALKKKKKQMDSEVDGWGALVLDPEGPGD